MASDDNRAPAATMPAIRDHRELQVCQTGIELAKRLYHLTGNFPAEEKFCLAGQTRRAAVSIPSNLAEGHARNATGEFVMVISRAEDSLAEPDTGFRLAVTRGLDNDAGAEPVGLSIAELQETSKGLRRRLALTPYL